VRIAVVILAAGEGKRMKSPMPKVLHKIFNKPMLQYVIASALKLKPSRIIVVAGKHLKQIKDSINAENISFALQQKPKGTGDALSKALPFLKGFSGVVLVLNGDVPLMRAESLSGFLKAHTKDKNDISLMSFSVSNPFSYGRIIRDTSGCLKSIVEEKDASPVEKKISEVNSGVYAIGSQAFKLISKIPLNKLKGEYYLTDIVGMAINSRLKVKAYHSVEEDEMAGVNTIAELMRAQRLLQKRIAYEWMGKSVTFYDPDSVFIYPDVMIGKGSIIYSNVYIEGRTKIGKDCIIYPGVRIINSTIGNGVTIKDSTIIDRSVVGREAVLGPFAHIRPESKIGSKAKIGNFVEVKKSVIGDRTKASHLSYLGDAFIGKNVNIGAGAITCNYDGREKHSTRINDNVFIGSDSQFVAPVEIGKGAYIGAGSTITKNVPPMSLSVSRVRQINIENWAAKRNLRSEKKARNKNKK
jgi:bifunctional UDP-N-acetylglucosamine pyrophosphorylase/glucosamine-1-phosphate N-acetyltransferase